MALTDKLTAIADAIRAKTGKADLLTLAQMPDEIASIKAGGSSSPVVGATGFDNVFGSYAETIGLMGVSVSITAQDIAE